MPFRVGIGQDSHRFVTEESKRPLKLAGITIPGAPALEGNSDADVVLHALCNAISGVTTEPILGEITDRMCLEENITDSAAYLQKALETLGELRVCHVSVALECQKPRITPHIPAMRESLARLLDLKLENVAITATSGEKLTDFGRGEGIQAFIALTAAPRSLLKAFMDG